MSHQHWKGEHTYHLSTFSGSCQKYPCACMYKPTILLLDGMPLIAVIELMISSIPLKEVAILILQL